MEDHFGQKIKSVATIFLVIDILGALISGSVLISSGLKAVGIVVIIAGIIVSLPLYYLMSGFGQLVENSDTIARYYQNKNYKEDIASEKTHQKKIIHQTEKVAEKINEQSVSDDEELSIDCPHCRETLYFTKEEIVNHQYLNCPYCDFQFSTSSFKITK